MEFIIAMELSREAWQVSFHHPLFYSYKRVLGDPNFPAITLIQDAYYLKSFQKSPFFG